MKLPELPTDNLYKFMALSGITILIISCLPFLHTHILEVQAIRLQGELKKLEAQTSWTGEDISQLGEDLIQLEEETDDLKNNVDQLKKDVDRQAKQTLPPAATVPVKGKAHKSEITEKAKRDFTIYRSKLNELEVKLNELKVKKLELIDAVRNKKILSIELATKTNELKYLLGVIRIEFVLAIVCALVGLLLGQQGFRLWYRKLQIPQDRIIQMNDRHKDAETANGSNRQNGVVKKAFLKGGKCN